MLSCVYVLSNVKLESFTSKCSTTATQCTKRGMHVSLRASFPIWASKASLARTRERAAKPRGTGAPRSRVLARLARPTRRACSRARCTCKVLVSLFCHSKPIEFLMFSLPSPSSLVKFPLSLGLCFQTTGARIGSIDEPALIPAKDDEV